MNIVDHAKIQLLLLRADLMSKKISLFLDNECSLYEKRDETKKNALAAKQNRLEEIIKLIAQTEEKLRLGLYEEGLPLIKNLILIIPTINEDISSARRLEILSETDRFLTNQLFIGQA